MIKNIAAAFFATTASAAIGALAAVCGAPTARRFLVMLDEQIALAAPENTFVDFGETLRNEGVVAEA